MSTRDLPDFLLARIAEDEVVARGAAPAPWDYSDVASVAGGSLYDPTVMIASLHYEQPGEVDPRIRRTILSDEADGTGTHIARHDPARVLADCQAKRRIVELRTGTTERVPQWVLDDVLQNLALAYADHPDYRDEWKP